MAGAFGRREKKRKKLLEEKKIKENFDLLIYLFYLELNYPQFWVFED